MLFRILRFIGYVFPFIPVLFIRPITHTIISFFHTSSSKMHICPENKLFPAKLHHRLVRNSTIVPLGWHYSFPRGDELKPSTRKELQVITGRRRVPDNRPGQDKDNAVDMTLGNILQLNEAPNMGAPHGNVLFLVILLVAKSNASSC